MKPADWAKLKAQIEKVQALGLERVDARACNIGQDANSMSAMQQFFNCSTFCSPKILDSFGSINYGQFVKDPNTFDKWVKEHPGAVVSGSAGDRFGFFQNLWKGVASEAIAESAKGVKAWANSEIAGRRQFHRQQPALLSCADRPQDIRLRGQVRLPRPAGRGHQGQRAIARHRHQQRAPGYRREGVKPGHFLRGPAGKPPAALCRLPQNPARRFGYTVTVEGVAMFTRYDFVQGLLLKNVTDPEVRDESARPCAISGCAPSRPASPRPTNACGS